MAATRRTASIYVSTEKTLTKQRGKNEEVLCKTDNGNYGDAVRKRIARWLL